MTSRKSKYRRGYATVNQTVRAAHCDACDIAEDGNHAIALELWRSLFPVAYLAYHKSQAGIGERAGLRSLRRRSIRGVIQQGLIDKPTGNLLLQADELTELGPTGSPQDVVVMRQAFDVMVAALPAQAVPAPARRRWGIVGRVAASLASLFASS